jgi:hypothetical protein
MSILAVWTFLVNDGILHMVWCVKSDAERILGVDAFLIVKGMMTHSA